MGLESASRARMLVFVGRVGLGAMPLGLQGKADVGMFDGRTQSR